MCINSYIPLSWIHNHLSSYQSIYKPTTLSPYWAFKIKKEIWNHWRAGVVKSNRGDTSSDALLPPFAAPRTSVHEKCSCGSPGSPPSNRQHVCTPVQRSERVMIMILLRQPARAWRDCYIIRPWTHWCGAPWSSDFNNRQWILHRFWRSQNCEIGDTFETPCCPTNIHYDTETSGMRTEFEFPYHLSTQVKPEAFHCPGPEFFY